MIPIPQRTSALCVPSFGVRVAMLIYAISGREAFTKHPAFLRTVTSEIFSINNSCKCTTARCVAIWNSFWTAEQQNVAMP